MWYEGAEGMAGTFLVGGAFLLDVQPPAEEGVHL